MTTKEYKEKTIESINALLLDMDQKQLDESLFLISKIHNPMLGKHRSRSIHNL